MSSRAPVNDTDQVDLVGPRDPRDPMAATDQVALVGPPGATGETGEIEEFGPYIVYECLGRGGMATVHRAEKRGVGIRRPIALKRLLPHVAEDPELIQLFVDEARLASHLHHANVAQTYELGKVGDVFFIAMEYASGPTLTQIVRQCRTVGADLPVEITVSILGQICEALDHAHNLCDASGKPLRIIHRDVSPANVIVTNTGVVKLIDFGIAKATTSRVKTQTGFIKGKFGYIAPEYLSGRFDARVDLFATGVVAHELLTGRRLFEGKDDFETMTNIRDLPVLPPSRWNPRVTPDLDDIVMTALARDPDRRWQSAGAMQVALANAARELGVVVGNPQIVAWVAWAFSQVPPDREPEAGDARTDARAEARRREVSTVSLPTRAEPRVPTDAATPVLLAIPTPAPSDADATVPLDRARGDRAPRASRTLAAAAPPPPRASRPYDAVSPPPAPVPGSRPSRARDAVSPPPAPAQQPPRPRPRSMRSTSARPPPEPPPGAARLPASRPRPAPARRAGEPPAPRATAHAAGKTAGRAAATAPRRRGRMALWLALALVVLAAGATAAVHLWPAPWR